MTATRRRAIHPYRSRRDLRRQPGTIPLRPSACRGPAVMRRTGGALPCPPRGAEAHAAAAHLRSRRPIARRREPAVL